MMRRMCVICAVLLAACGSSRPLPDTTPGDAAGSMDTAGDATATDGRAGDTPADTPGGDTQPPGDMAPGDGVTADTPGGDDAPPGDTLAADADTGSPCPPGFSGPDCNFCTWATAGAACRPGAPADLVDLAAIKALTLADLEWTLTDTREEDGVTVYFGDWSGGLYRGYDPQGNPVDETLREAAAVYVPADWPNTANAQFGLVYAAHYPQNIDTRVAAGIARYYGLPVLYHGEYPNWTRMGYPTRGDITQATGVHLIRANPCEPVDFVRGNFPLALATTDMRAITLLQRLAEVGGGHVERVALRGFSKEGAATWLAALIDDRIEVAIPGGSHGQDSLEAGRFTEAAYGCAPGSALADDVQGTVDGRNWRLSTPAGAASINLLSTAHNKDQFLPRMFVIDGDVGMFDMHDGSHGMPAGDESAFLDGFVERPWRYVRKATTETGADGDDGDMTSKTVVPLLGVELLVAGPGSEGTLYPNILVATAEFAGDTLLVSATATANAEYARVWWTGSPDRIFTDVEQAPWTSVDMAATGEGQWASPPIAVPAGMVIAWYAEVGNTFTIRDTIYARNHAAPIRLERATPALHCEPTPTAFCP